MTPAETEIALNLIKNSNENILDEHIPEEQIDIKDLTLFNGDFGFPSISNAFENGKLVNEAHLESCLVSNPCKYLPSVLKPNGNYVICRQVHISPFKPMNMDRADICIYLESEQILDGSLPNEIIELKKERANGRVIEQIQRYLRWMELVLQDYSEQFNKVRVNLLAPSYTKNIKNLIISKYKDKIKLYDFSGELL